MRINSILDEVNTDFTPLTRDSEGNLRGGFGTIFVSPAVARLANNCMCNRNNCDCLLTPATHPNNNCDCSKIDGDYTPVSNNCNCDGTPTVTTTTAKAATALVALF
jgi:hypothetical protein